MTVHNERMPNPARMSANTYRWRYPGDPTLTATVQTGREFLAGQSQPREIVIYTGDILGGQVDAAERIPMEDKIICDCCNAGIGLDDVTTLTMDRLYCAKCAAEWIEPYRLVE